MKRIIMTEISLEELTDLIRSVIREEVEAAKLHENENKFYNIEEAAKYLSISKGTIYSWKNNGKLAGHKAGGKVVFKKDELEACLKKWNKYDI
jgi:excisionase family DNA binding protein